MTRWRFLTNHAQILLQLSRDPDLRVRDLAERVGITERAVSRIVGELTRSDYLEVHKRGRRNRYRVRTSRRLGDPPESGATVGDLVQLLAAAPPAR